MLVDELKKFGKQENFVPLKISAELVRLLSDQLYQSPLKAVEELVVNSYDARATICSVFVPSAEELASATGLHFIAVFDNGTGLTAEGMTDLWHVGRSNKRTEEIAKLSSRKLIGKFGIGKLATYAVADRLTYVSKNKTGIISTTLDFRDLKSDVDGSTPTIQIPLIDISDWKSFAGKPASKAMFKAVGITDSYLSNPTWTLVVLESLKEKAHRIRLNNLKWVLGTAMPLQSEFRLFLNNEEIKSVKESYETAAKFNVSDLPNARLLALKDKTGEVWSVKGGSVVSPSFPNGISGTVLVTERTLPGKSDDLMRSNGFFIRVLGRLINQDEPFFGMTHVYYGTENRFRADINADDLDQIITAPRESIEASTLRDKFESFLLEVFQEARQRYEEFLKKKEAQEKEKKEHVRTFVSPSLIEHTIASALTQFPERVVKNEDSWFYFAIDQSLDVKELVARLYSAARAQFSFQYAGLGKSARLVKFNPATSTFTINSDHEFVQAYSEEPQSKLLLEDMVLAEALLEAQLRNNGVPPQIISEALQARDSLLRGLALDHPFSCSAVAKSLLDAAADKHNLEIALVAAARSLGFVAKHISGSSEPDGLATFVEYPSEITTITLEAKSSKDVPTLSHLDIAGVEEHVEAKKAQGCLLLAPDYPNPQDSDSAVANRARSGRISCWRIADLARIVEASESRHINAKRILEIVLNKFAPLDVEDAVKKLFEEPAWDRATLNGAIVDVLRKLDGKLLDTQRSVDLIAGMLLQEPRFHEIGKDDVYKAVSNLAASSQGALVMDGEKLVLLTSYDELARRVADQTGNGNVPLRQSKIRTDLNTQSPDDEAK